MYKIIYTGFLGCGTRMIDLRTMLYIRNGFHIGYIIALNFSAIKLLPMNQVRLKIIIQQYIIFEYYRKFMLLASYIIFI